ncbi:MAG: NADH:ubiquinone oxidoreductase subunit NDUFA12 [Alphaproteobacteria bacterium 41-28]|nr:MAG: NADH:ubiquinone oxidoreductase subunit NDUFA12 [Alphaproteobacteria bacterium 41-28]
MLWIKLLTWLKGELVGEDSFGNKYYREKGPESLKERRWVIYKGIPEASKVPAEWHGWLHHTIKKPPPIDQIKRWPWEKDHLPNLSGTPYAYRPPGHFYAGGKRTPATGDYEAWRPHEVRDEN